jgi:hypothetical protein
MMQTARRERVRGKCPECQTPVHLDPEELGRNLLCNICGTTFVVERKRRRRRKDGYVKYDLADVEWIDAPSRAMRSGPVRWMILMIALAALLTLVAVYGAEVPDLLRRLFRMP